MKQIIVDGPMVYTHAMIGILIFVLNQTSIENFH